MSVAMAGMAVSAPSSAFTTSGVSSYTSSVSIPPPSLISSSSTTPSRLTSVTSHPPPFSAHYTPPPSSSIPLPPPTISPSLPPPPANSTSDMALPPNIYLVAIPVALVTLLIVIISLACCIIICIRVRRKKSPQKRSQSFNEKSSIDRIGHPKSLEAYNGGSPNALRKTDDSAMRYELQTVDTANRISTGSSHTHNPQSGRTPLSGERLHPAASSSNPQINSLQRDACHSSDHFTGVGASTSHVIPALISPHRTTPGLQQQGVSQLDGVPERPSAQAAQAKIAAELKAGLLSKNTAHPDPTSLYDVPSSALANAPANTYPGAGLGLYDVPKSALIASGHYRVPPLALAMPVSDGIYDVPPSAVYDVPPDYYDFSGKGSDLYDVPPPSGTRPRLNSLPTSQKELVDARTSVFGSPGSDNVFGTSDIPQLGPNYGHYDVPKHLMMAYMEQNKTSLMHDGKQRSQRNSNPMSQYDVPRKALMMADFPSNLPGPPTAPKPTRRGSKVSRSSSFSSPIASPDYRPHPNAIFYDILPLDPEVLAQGGGKVNEADTSQKPRQHNEGTSIHGENKAPKRRHSMPSTKKKKVPPPTRTKPKKRDEIESEH